MDSGSICNNKIVIAGLFSNWSIPQVCSKNGWRIIKKWLEAKCQEGAKGSIVCSSSAPLQKKTHDLWPCMACLHYIGFNIVCIALLVKRVLSCYRSHSFSFFGTSLFQQRAGTSLDMCSLLFLSPPPKKIPCSLAFLKPHVLRLGAGGVACGFQHNYQHRCSEYTTVMSIPSCKC